jgi:putative membrane protein
MKLYSSVIIVIGHKLFWFGLLFGIVWANSLIGTTDVKNWFIENTLTVMALLFLMLTYAKYRFSNYSYFLICIFLCLHVYGSKYTYAQNLFGYWLQEVFHSLRNQYDRLVHFSFGLLLYYPLQECLSYWVKISKKVALKFPVLIILSASALYEIIEWLVADVFFVEQGLSYLGTQGDVWDAQKDMAVAFLGVVFASVGYSIYSVLKKS